jgi:hypothetical protein
MRTNGCGIRYALLVLGAMLIAGAASGAAFQTGCGPLPFKSIQQPHPIDQTCGINGVFDTPEHKAQNRAKNNFCATGTLLTMSFEQFADLETAVVTAGVIFGARDRLPPDRSVLVDLIDDGQGGRLGEGRLVRVAAFVVDAKNSNKSKGESVNCKKGGKTNNDIHISLGKHDDDDLCDTITAEISPHFRPSDWTKENLESIGRRPVRITGHLFFDASHQPCHDGHGGSPDRFSIWEIHPVYAVDVCRNKKLTSCDPNDDSKWEPLNKWADRQADPEEH